MTDEERSRNKTIANTIYGVLADLLSSDVAWTPEAVAEVLASRMAAVKRVFDEIDAGVVDDE